MYTLLYMIILSTITRKHRVGDPCDGKRLRRQLVRSELLSAAMLWKFREVMSAVRNSSKLLSAAMPEVPKLLWKF